MIQLCPEGTLVEPWIGLQHARQDAPCEPHDGPEVKSVQQVADGQTISREPASETSEERVAMIGAIFATMAVVEVGAPKNGLEWRRLFGEVRDVPELRRRLQDITLAQPKGKDVLSKHAPLFPKVPQATLQEHTTYKSC